MSQPDTGYEQKWWAMLGIGMGVFMSTLDASIVNISLPTLVTELNTTFATVQWVVLSYLLVITTMILGIARLGDMLGKKKLYNLGMVLFTIGSLLCGLAPGVGWLIGFRALQGTGAVMMTALGTAIITEVFPASERGRALGINGSIVSVGIALGPALGGILIGLFGWRSVFLVNVPVGILAAIIVYRVVPSSAARDTGAKFDYAGAVIMLFVLGFYALGLTVGQNIGFEKPAIIAMLVSSGVGVAAFIMLESRLRSPMVDLKIFRNILFGVNLLMGLLVFIMIGGFFIIPFFLEVVQGYSTEQTGLLMMVFPVLMGITAPISGSLSDRFGSRVISLIGLVIIAAGCLALSTLAEGIPWYGFALRIAPLGIGVGMFNSPNNSAIMGAVSRERLGIASGLLALTRTLGQTTGLPLIGAIFSSVVVVSSGLMPGFDVNAAPASALVAGVTGTYRILAYLVFLSAGLAAFALWFDRQQRQQPESAPAGVDVH